MTAFSSSSFASSAASGRSNRLSQSLALCALPLVLASAGCGKKSNISVRIIVPPGVADPFQTATTVRMTFKDQQTTANVTGGKFDVQLELDQPSASEYVAVGIEALDAGGQVLGRGRTPNFVYQAVQDDLAVYVGRPGQASASDLKLPDDQGSQAAPLGRKEMVGALLRGRQVTPTPEPSLGALLVGGVGELGNTPTKAWLYKPLTHTLVDAGKPMQARRGAVLVPSTDVNQGQQAVMAFGADPNNGLLTAVDKFDPQVASLSAVWAAPDAAFADTHQPGSYRPTACVLSDGLALVSGGSSSADPNTVTALQQAVLLKRNPGNGTDMTVILGATRIDASMMAPRALHSANRVTTGDGTGALLYGGLAMADEANFSVAELYLADKNVFQKLDLTPQQPSRRGHVGHTLSTGRVFIAGGYSGPETSKTVLGSVLVIDAQAHTVEVRSTPDKGSLKTPRYAASVAQMNTEVVVCGGYNQAGEPIADCELFSVDTGQPTRAPTPLPIGRAEHVAIAMENDLMLLVGGVGPDKKALAAIDFYSAR